MGDKKRKLNFSIKGLGVIVILLVVIIYSALSIGQSTFNTEGFSADKVYKHTEELSSQKYEGRRAGTEGNVLALKYIEEFFKTNGIEPAGDDGTYYQNFDSVVPVYNSEPQLVIRDSSGKVLEDLEVGVDFREIISGYGGTGQGEGKLFYIDRAINSYSTEEIKGKMLLVNHPPTNGELEYAVDNSSVGVIYSGGAEEIGYQVDVSKKQGKTILLTRASYSGYKKLFEYSRENVLISINYDINFKLMNTPNILGKIEGRKKNSGYIIISSSVDGFGSVFNGRYFPGALSNASGTAMLLELSRLIVNQELRPDKTIIFAAWNNNISSYSGSGYYANKPIYPLEGTNILFLEQIGGKKFEEMQIFAEETPGETLQHRLLTIGEDLGLRIRRLRRSQGNINEPFVKKGVPAVVMKGSYFGGSGLVGVDTLRDTIDTIDRGVIEKNAALIIEYFKIDIFKDIFSNLLSASQFFITLLFILGIIGLYLVEMVHGLKPHFKIGKFSVEDIYYSSLYNLLLRFYKISVPILLVLITLAFILNMPTNFNLIATESGIKTNTPLGLVFRRSIEHIENLIIYGPGNSLKGYPVIKVVGYSFVRSIRMVFFAIAVSVIIGINNGIRAGFKRRDRESFGSIGTLTVLSIPDVLIALSVQLLVVYLIRSSLWNPFFESINNSKFILPFLCLSIIPAIYISRITTVAVREEMKRDYVRAARAKGLSRGEVLRKHMLRAIVIKVVDSMQSVLSIIISNLIIVEILFAYPSISSNLVSYIQERDINVAIGLVVALGLIYLIFTLMIKIAARLINPFKKGGAH